MASLVLVGEPARLAPRGPPLIVRSMRHDGGHIVPAATPSARPSAAARTLELAHRVGRVAGDHSKVGGAHRRHARARAVPLGPSRSVREAPARRSRNVLATGTACPWPTRTRSTPCAGSLGSCVTSSIATTCCRNCAASTSTGWPGSECRRQRRRSTTFRSAAGPAGYLRRSGIATVGELARLSDDSARRCRTWGRSSSPRYAQRWLRSGCAGRQRLACSCGHAGVAASAARGKQQHSQQVCGWLLLAGERSSGAPAPAASPDAWNAVAGVGSACLPISFTRLQCGPVPHKQAWTHLGLRGRHQRPRSSRSSCSRSRLLRSACLVS